MTTMTRAASSVGRLGTRDGRRALVLLIVAILAGAAIGRSVANDQIMFAGLLGGFVLVLVLAQRPWLPYVGCAALVATFATPSSLPQFSVPGNPTLSDLLLIAAFASWFLLLARGDVERPSAFPLAPQLVLGIFLGAAVAGIAVGRANGGASSLVAARDIAYFSTFWLALTVFGDRERRAFMIKVAAYGAVLVVVAQIAQGFLGLSHMLFYDAEPLRELIRCPSGGCANPLAEGFPRVRPPGLVLVYVVTCFACSYLLWGPRRKRKPALLLLAVCMVGLLVSLNRNMLIGLTAGLFVTGLLTSRRGRFAVAAAVVAVGVLVSFTLAESSATVRNNSIAARVLSLSSTSELEGSATVTDRLHENNAALDSLSKSRILGIGWGASYGMREIVFQDGEFRVVSRGFIHNQYLGLWLRTGLIGLVAFLGALGLALTAGTRWMRARSEDDDAWIGAGIVTSVTAIAVSSIVAIYVIHPSWAAVIAGLMALAASLQRELVRSTASPRGTLAERRAFGPR